MIRKKKKPDITLAEITNRIRGFLLDSQVSDAYHMSTILGCSVVSDEVATMEEEESDLRVAKVDHLIPVIYAYAHAMAEGTVEHQKAHLDDEDVEAIPDSAWASTRKVFTQVSMNTTLGAISQLVDMGFLTVAKNKKGLFR